MDSKIIYTISVFYIVLAIFFVLLGQTSEEATTLLTPPVYPDLNPITEIPILSIVAGFVFFFIDLIAYIFLLLVFIVTIMKFTFTSFLPYWISVPVFTPLGLILLVQIAKLARGN